LKKKEEQQARLAAEEKAAREEQERRDAEEAKRKEEAKALKKQREKEKIAQLKKEGKYLTKAQKEQQARNEMRLKQMLQTGSVQVAGAEDGATEKHKRPVYDRKRKGGKKGAEETKKDEDEAQVEEKLEELKIEETPEPEIEEPVAQPEPEEDELEDWEAMADAQDGVKESWDMETDEEEAKAPAKVEENPKAPAKAAEAQPVANGKATQKPTAKAASAHPTKKQESESESESESEEDSSEEEEEERGKSATQRAEAARKAAAAERRQKQHEEAQAARSKDNLRSPICCILGHVDTGKTKLLDKIRQTNVQEGEAGGITQQIGATYFPVDALKKKVEAVNKDNSFEFRVPGLLIIDTPGHESFTNLRSRGSSLCNMAILVIDIMHGLEPQTIESLNLLKQRKTPFIVALNKIDRLYGWKKIDNNGFRDSLNFQNKTVHQEFKNRLDFVKTQLAEQGLNSELYYENKSLARNVSIVPTSAHTGEGIPDILRLLVQLTQERLTQSLMYSPEVECTVLEVKVIEGLGTTIDVVLSQGTLREGDRIALCGNPEPIATNIRALLTPAEMKELRVKSQYVHQKEIKAAMGIKIAAEGLETAIAGSRLVVVGKDDDEEDILDDLQDELRGLLGKVNTSRVGVSVQASTLGSLEALLEFLKVEKVPVAEINIGPVFKRHLNVAQIMLEKAKEYAMLLAFDVKIDKDAQEFADKSGITIFKADIIYHLFDAYKAHQEKYKAQLKEDAKMNAVFPCELKTVAVFNKKDPIVIGVDVLRGNLRLLTPIASVKTNPVTKIKEIVTLGRV
jgi:translation initiation factor 5B